MIEEAPTKILSQSFLVRLVSIDLLLGSSYNVKIQKFAVS